METYHNPTITQLNSGFPIDTRNTPFSQGTYKVVFNCQRQDPVTGAFTFNTEFHIPKRFIGVKSISLLYARFPPVVNVVAGDNRRSDHLVTIVTDMKNGSFVGSYPKQTATVGAVTTGAQDVITGAFASLVNPAPLVTLTYQADYPVVETFITPISLRSIRFRFFNALGLPLGYGEGPNAAVNEVVLCFEIACQGVQ